MTEDFSDIVAQVKAERSHRPTVITLGQIVRGNIPDPLSEDHTLNREKEFSEALGRWYQATAEPQVIND